MVLPYVAVSLIACLGGMTLSDAGRLATRTGLVLLVTWVIAISIVMVIGLGFPDWEKASFFSSSALEAPVQIQFVELYIPANPFNESNVIVAGTGAALIGGGAAGWQYDAATGRIYANHPDATF